SSSQPIVRPRSRGSLPRLPYAASVGGLGAKCCFNLSASARTDLSLGKNFRPASSHTRRRRGHRWWYPVEVASLAHSSLPDEPADLHRALRGGLQRAPRAPFDCR